MRRAARKVGRGELAGAKADRSQDVAVWQTAVKDVRRSVVTLVPLPPLIPPSSERYTRSRRLDLHGLTIEEAYQATQRHLDESDSDTLTIITGKSGGIREEFAGWMQHIGEGYRVEELRGGGAFRLHRRK